MWILKLKSVDSEAEKCGFVKKNSHFFYCLIPKVWFKCNELWVGGGGGGGVIEHNSYGPSEDTNQ